MCWKELKRGRERLETWWQRYVNDRERRAESRCSEWWKWKCLSGDMCISISSEEEGHDIEWRWHSEICSSQEELYKSSSSSLYSLSLLLSLWPLIPLLSVFFLSVFAVTVFYFFSTLSQRNTHHSISPKPRPQRLISDCKNKCQVSASFTWPQILYVTLGVFMRI